MASSQPKKVRWVWVEKEVKVKDRVTAIGLPEGVTPTLPPRPHFLPRKADAGVVVIGYWEQQEAPPKIPKPKVEVAPVVAGDGDV